MIILCRGFVIRVFAAENVYDFHDISVKTLTP